MITFALIVAAGESSRLGGEVPKPYIPLGGIPILRRSVATFLIHPRIDGVRVVVRREHHALYKAATEGLTLFPLVVGGMTRQESVRKGLEALWPRTPERILIHDAARPLVSAALIDRVLDGLNEHEAVLPVLPVMDTLKRETGNGKLETVERKNLLVAQTPQGFRFATIYDLHRRYAAQSFTDDMALAEAAGIPIQLVAGDTRNFKITAQDDLDHARYLV